MSQKQSKWTTKTYTLIKELHLELTLNNKNWHKLKNNNSRRSAELLSSALCQIINDGNKNDIESLIQQSLLWIRKEVKDPGCPSH